ncbi:MAG: hypothetical protein U0457_11890 [Candidatus Sericytochromatia bacterium]
MDIKIKDTHNDKLIDAEISKASFVDMPLKTNGWNFNWRKLFKEKGIFYKLTVKERHNFIEGIIKLEILNNEMLYMNNLEIAPHNYGSSGKYDYVAGCLISYACYLSFIEGKNHYKGFLVFDSKTKLIDLYKIKYQAEILFGQRMFIDANNSKKLIEKYLKVII